MRFLTKKRSVLVLLAVVSLAFWIPGQAGAVTTFDSTFSFPNSDLSAVQGPFAELHIEVADEGSTTATVKVTVDNPTHFLIGDVIGLQLTKDATASGFSYTSPAGNTPTFVNQKGSSPPVDGFGGFNTTLNFGTDDNARFYSVTFILTVVPAASDWTDASSVLGVNAGGYDAALHIFTDIIGANDEAITGFAAEKPGIIFVPAPIPPSALLLGSGLLGLGLVGWRRREKKS
jgi:hypothetical protein